MSNIIIKRKRIGFGSSSLDPSWFYNIIIEGIGSSFLDPIGFINNSNNIIIPQEEVVLDHHISYVQNRC